MNNHPRIISATSNETFAFKTLEIGAAKRGASGDSFPSDMGLNCNEIYTVTCMLEFHFHENIMMSMIQDWRLNRINSQDDVTKNCKLLTDTSKCITDTVSRKSN